MHLTHIALWTNDMERLRDFYVWYFEGKSNEKYVNPKKGFASYFVSFEEGPSLEIMQRQDVTERYEPEHIGLAHLAFHADTNAQVDRMIGRFRTDGYTIAGETRTSGDGYYEGVVLDPDGNRVEIVANGRAVITKASSYPYELLLEADPDRAKVEAYLPQSDCFVATVGGDTMAGVVVVCKQGEGLAEVMNLAVADIFRRRGIARQLLHYIIDRWAKEHSVIRLRVCTASSSVAPLMLYQQAGFDLVAIDRDYFVRNYSEPIWEKGMPCRHRLVFERSV